MDNFGYKAINSFFYILRTITFLSVMVYGFAGSLAIYNSVVGDVLINSQAFSKILEIAIGDGWVIAWFITVIIHSFYESFFSEKL